MKTNKLLLIILLLVSIYSFAQPSGEKKEQIKEISGYYCSFC